MTMNSISPDDVEKRIQNIEKVVLEIRNYYDRATKYQSDDPESALTNARKATEAICIQLCRTYIDPNYDTDKNSLDTMIQQLAHTKKVPRAKIALMQVIQKFGNIAAHAGSEKITESDLVPCLSSLSGLISWYMDVNASGCVSTPRPLNKPAFKPPPFRFFSLLVALSLLSCLVVAGGYAAYNARNHYVYDTLATYGRQENYQRCYQMACHYQNQWLLDKSIPAYWRSSSKMYMTSNEWWTKSDAATQKLVEEELLLSIRTAGEGSRTDDIYYQMARFYRLTKQPEKAKEVFELIFKKYLNSNWRQGTTFYLGLIYCLDNELDKATEMLDKMSTFDDAIERISDMDRPGRFISISEARERLKKEIESSRKFQTIKGTAVKAFIKASELGLRAVTNYLSTADAPTTNNPCSSVTKEDH